MLSGCPLSLFSVAGGLSKLLRYLGPKSFRNLALGFSTLSFSRNSFMKFFLKTESGGGMVVDRFLRVHATAICSLIDVSFTVCPSILILKPCLLYTSDAADEEDSVDLGGRRII